MLTYKQYLTESSSWKHVATGFAVVSGVSITPGDVYYTNDSGELHRLDGPAFKDMYGVPAWYIDGRFISRHVVLSDSVKWQMLRANIENNLPLFNRMPIRKKMQEYICKKRPDLVGQIKNLDPGLRDKYSHEEELSGVDL